PIPIYNKENSGYQVQPEREPPDSGRAARPDHADLVLPHRPVRGSHRGLSADPGVAPVQLERWQPPHLDLARGDGRGAQANRSGRRMGRVPALHYAPVRTTAAAP